MAARGEDSFNPPKAGFEDLDQALAGNDQMLCDSNLLVEGANDPSPFKQAAAPAGGLMDQQADAKVEAQAQGMKEAL